MRIQRSPGLRALLALCLAAGGLPSCLPSESGGPVAIGADGGATGGTPAPGVDGGGAGGNVSPPGGGNVSPPGGGDVPPPSGGDVPPPSGGDVPPPTGGGMGTGGAQGCVPDCTGRECGPDGCGDTCGAGCGNGEVCTDGQCMAGGCTGDAIDCDGECSTLLADVNHCGNCRTQCPTNAGANAVPVCIDAECYLTCRGHEREPASIDFTSDPANCGRCGNACPTALGGNPTCDGGRCGSPCEPGYELCQDRCLPSDQIIGDNCNGACCPEVRPGATRGAALRADDAHAYTLVVNGRQHVSVRLRFDDGSCPGFSSPFDTSNSSAQLSLLAPDDLGNRNVIARGRLALGDATDCVALDGVVEGGAYDIQLYAAEALPAHSLTIVVDAAPAARAGNATLDRTGTYPRAIPGDGAAQIPVHVANPAHVLVVGVANDVNNRDETDGCLYGELALNDGANFGISDDDHCPVLDVVLPAGDYTLQARRTFGDADPTFRAAAWVSPIGGNAQPVPDGGMLQGGGLGAFEADRYTFNLANASSVSFQFQGDCQDARIAIDTPWDYNDDDPCGLVQANLQAGPHEIWIHGARWAPLANYVMITSAAGGGGPGPGPGGDVIAASGNYRRGPIAQGSQDVMTLRLGAFSTVTLSTGDGAGGCPADTTMTLSQFGNQLAFDDDGGNPSPCSRVSMDLDAGDYEVMVAGYSGAAVPAYVLSATIQ